MEAESNLRHWESEAKEVAEWAVCAEAERDAACHEVAMARLETEAAGSSWAQVESELAWVQCALVASKDAWRKVELSYSGLSRLWLLLERPGERRRRKLIV